METPPIEVIRIWLKNLSSMSKKEWWETIKRYRKWEKMKISCKGEETKKDRKFPVVIDKNEKRKVSPRNEKRKKNYPLFLLRKS